MVTMDTLDCILEVYIFLIVLMLPQMKSNGNDVHKELHSPFCHGVANYTIIHMCIPNITTMLYI